MMKGNSKGKYGSSSSSSQKSTKEKEKHLVDKIQGIFTNLQSARKESRANDIVICEEQMHQLLREWKAELESPATSLADGSFGSFTGELAQLLQEIEEKDDATSSFTSPVPLKTGLHQNNISDGNYPFFLENCFENNQTLDHTFKGSASSLFNSPLNNSDMAQLDFHQFGLNQDMDHNAVGHNSDLIGRFNLYQDQSLGHNTEIKNSESTQFSFEEGIDCSQFFGDNDTTTFGDNLIPNILPNICPPPSAFLSPKCALWDCIRPAQKQCQGYCCSSHEHLAISEGLPGMTPILRPGGIDVKDGPLFAAVLAKTMGKEVGIPKCEGAASTKAPWNASEFFDISFLEGETVREWLFFDKPRRAFDSGTRKQRSLPDYHGRGWHESRKQVMKEHGGQKRSYYMDPQPPNRDWHLYEYEINSHDGCALYRLELKLVDKKKSPKGKVSKDSLNDLENKMGKLTAAPLPDNGKSIEGKTDAKSENVGLPA
ncbi:transcription factor VOZ1-like isoform X2 [Trifolium pratense]|nr:transcription factor VOZ1-like isoform X2 [Trifolium pratense]XP_045812306.1 transcription factor VOZ1-like isoform X2 [Trifolium pratense]XP_045812307.1 transcription factor VOZ1-like isoform X2 [Trifolium pratense]XP_045812308.1 transcription factor VOZ1-like isoform X2 [Trifolium pratense]